MKKLKIGDEVPTRTTFGMGTVYGIEVIRFQDVEVVTDPEEFDRYYPRFCDHVDTNVTRIHLTMKAPVPEYLVKGAQARGNRLAFYFDDILWAGVEGDELFVDPETGDLR